MGEDTTIVKMPLLYSPGRPDDDEIMGADLIFKDIMKQIDDIGSSLETHIKQVK